jgi:hypothetical protein
LSFSSSEAFEADSTARLGQNVFTEVAGGRLVHRLDRIADT